MTRSSVERPLPSAKVSRVVSAPTFVAKKLSSNALPLATLPVTLRSGPRAAFRNNSSAYRLILSRFIAAIMLAKGGDGRLATLTALPGVFPS